MTEAHLRTAPKAHLTSPRPTPRGLLSILDIAMTPKVLRKLLDTLAAHEQRDASERSPRKPACPQPSMAKA